MQTFNFIMMHALFMMHDAYHYLCDTVRWVIVLWYVFMQRKSSILFAESAGVDVTAIVRGYYLYSSVMSTYTLAKWMVLWKRPDTRVYILYRYNKQVYHACLNLSTDVEMISHAYVDSVSLRDLPKLQPNIVWS